MDADPYAILRNTETLEAHRVRAKAARAAGQPFLAIALIVYVIEIGMIAYGVFSGRLHAAVLSGRVHDLAALMSILSIGGGAAFVVAGIRISLYLWAHPASSTVARRAPWGWP